MFHARFQKCPLSDHRLKAPLAQKDAKYLCRYFRLNAVKISDVGVKIAEEFRFPEFLSATLDLFLSTRICCQHVWLRSLRVRAMGRVLLQTLQLAAPAA